MQIPGNSTDADILNSFSQDSNEYELDLASNSRLAKDFENAHGEIDWGSFTFGSSPLFTRGIGHHYFGRRRDEQWKRIIYGSILHTGCKKLVSLDMKYIVVDDEQIPDDPINNIYWTSGDSHAKASNRIFQLLKLSSDYLSETDPVDWSAASVANAMQFRLAKPAKYKPEFVEGFIGKGTFEYSERLNYDSDADFVIPLSSMKGNKLPLGNYVDRIILGYVFESEWRSAKTGWMLFQHFTWDTLIADGIVSNIEQICIEFANAYNSIEKLAELLRIDYMDRKENAESYSEEEIDILEEYEDKFLKIVRSDRTGILLSHPFIVQNLQQRLRKQWLVLAKSGGVRFYSFMTMPDESLADYNVWDDEEQKNFCIEGRVCCCPDLDEGEYIMFVNPMRNWGDCQIWENKHEGLFTNRRGIVAAPNKLFLTLGRDFDGDFVQMMHVEEYPNIAQAVKKFELPPKVRKLPKEKISGNLQEIAVNSMSNATGLVAALQGIAIAHGLANAPFTVPIGGTFTEETEMTIIEFLGQELQIAVDSLKSSTPNNMAGIQKLQQYFKELGKEIPWQKGFKDPQVYLTKICPVANNAEDTISKLVNLVNSLWKQAQLPESTSPSGFRDVLFKSFSFDSNQEQIATKYRDEYRQFMAEAIAYKETTESSRKIQEVLEYFREEKPKILSIINQNTGQIYEHFSWVKAFWDVCHRAESGKGGVVFQMFTDEICEELMQERIDYRKIQIMGVQYNEVPNFASYQNQSILFRFLLKQHPTGLPKRPDGTRPKDKDGNIIKTLKWRTVCQMQNPATAEWLLLGFVLAVWIGPPTATTGWPDITSTR